MSESGPEPRGGGGGGNILTRKFGPLPGWAWLGIVVAGAAVVIYIRRKKSSSSASTSATGTAASSGCTDASGNPVDCGSTAAVSDIGTSQWEALYTQQQGIESTLQNVYALLQGTQGTGTTGTTGSGDGTGSGIGSGSSGGSSSGPLPQPGGLHVALIQPTSVRVGWSPVPGATGYVAQLKRGGDNGVVVNGPFSVPASQAYANFAPLTPSTQYTALIWPSSSSQQGGPGSPQPHAEFEFTTPAKK